MLLVTALAGHLTIQLAGLIRKLHSGRYSIVVQILMQIVRQFLVEWFDGNSHSGIHTHKAFALPVVKIVRRFDECAFPHVYLFDAPTVMFLRTTCQFYCLLKQHDLWHWCCHVARFQMLRFIGYAFSQSMEISFRCGQFSSRDASRSNDGFRIWHPRRNPNRSIDLKIAFSLIFDSLFFFFVWICETVYAIYIDLKYKFIGNANV